MDTFIINGGQRLSGSVGIVGAKNAVLSLLTAALLTDEPLIIENVPDLADVRNMLNILREVGAEVGELEGGRVEVCARERPNPEAPWELVRKMRASFEVLGPLLARCGEAKVSYPGGCLLGLRPVDVHLRGLEMLGATITRNEGDVTAVAPEGGLRGVEVYLGTPFGSSVGATRNVLMAAVLATGVTTLQSAACEPEIIDLIHCLNKMGAKIQGGGSPTLIIEGVPKLHGTTHRVIPDRIEAGTFLAAGALTGGQVRVTECCPEHLTSFLDAMQRAGVELKRGSDWIETQERDLSTPLRATDVTTQPYPGFPTDLQAQWVTLMTLADGISVVTERIFSDRYMHLAELQRLGAHVRRQGSVAIIEGIGELSGASIMASDLRASAALVMAGLVAKGETEIHRVYHIDRGYERIEERLIQLGGSIRRAKA